ncbi:hypothetical protein [Actinoalloteichus hymeniacidonis]|uniref:ABC-2 family transporter protein n=1 Tax=Actinoalloteichus hymeniacidonis TaxID=340345 RepID=A0AAC9MZJ7_9PSEU|nr:hypothetical protein [Actinoalloteichus hymeniacidonis]AOS65473.1 ABC-2 family transporter protein [Actinoalloteichus hymeniacidonis]MBB5906440.1 hypothetical protein [Actinoalloteichus hymeniacidonis]
MTGPYAQPPAPMNGPGPMGPPPHAPPGGYAPPMPGSPPPQTGPQPFPGQPHPSQPFPAVQPQLAQQQPPQQQLAQQQPAQPFPSQQPPPNPAAQPGSTPEWGVRAGRRIGFGTMVLVELRKLTGTRSDRLVLALAPVLFFGLVVAGALLSERMASAYDQMYPFYLSAQIGVLLFHAALIKLVAGEWQYKSVQTTLLVQPSRLRYLLAQGSVLGLVWLIASLVTIVGYPPIIDASTEANHYSYLLGHRLGWVVLVVVVALALGMLASLSIALLIPNTVGALVVYFLLMPALAMAHGIFPDLIGFIAPLELARYLISPDADLVPGIASGLLWTTLFVVGVMKLTKRDAG